MIWDLVDALLLIGAARDWSEAFAMPATVALMLCSARQRRNASAGPIASAGDDRGGDGEWRTNADGSRSMRIRSMETLASVLGAAK